MVAEREWELERERFHDDATPLNGPLAGEFVDLAARLLAARTVPDVLDNVVDTARRVVPGADLASITLRNSRGEYSTPVRTDPVAAELDHLQYRTGEGPCVHAADPAGDGTARSDELASGERWPRWGPAAAELGVHAVLSTALLPVSDLPRAGALNLYSYRAHGLDAADRDIALVLASHAAIALHAVRTASAADLESAQLREALQSRDVIGQAKGILMERRGVSADEAFDILRRSSQELNVRLADLARTLAERRAEL
ncbi:GAF and ANTAR domain-containing protein [Prauserella shujinwangii]|uniref:GAF and ANTAR domain-containing protein n=1 Tax=Prauserella shujinwangii TaxID=1453103 RepID=UPI000D0506C4|nr:GAF and ANTAR domain-containing protein [Prauserella shujinwangii]